MDTYNSVSHFEWWIKRECIIRENVLNKLGDIAFR